MRIFLTFLTSVVSGFGGANLTVFLFLYLGIYPAIALTFAFLVFALFFVFSLALIIDADFGREADLSSLSNLVSFFRLRLLIKSHKCKVIRSDIRAFLSDKNPSKIDCPYNLNLWRDRSRLEQAIVLIWEEEKKRRHDEMLLNTNLHEG